MKNVVKLIPVALGLLTLASCNNDDFYGSNNDIAGKLTLDVTTEGSDVTRAYASGTTDLAFTWGKNDQIRVFDKNMQKYDNFIYNTSAKKFVINNDPQYVADADYGYAIFGEEGCISYNGWQQDGADGVLTALVKIETPINYKQIYDADENPVYKAALPQWGTVTIVGEGDDKHLGTDLKYLTGYGYAVFKSLTANAVQKVRVRSLKYKSSATDEQKLAVRNLVMGNAITALTNACDENVAQPLNGWFNARMELNEEATVDSLKAGKMQKLTEGPLATYVAGSGTIEVDLGNNFTDGIVYLPIIPAWYEVLSFEYYDGTNWNVLRTLAPKTGETIGAKVGRMTKIGKMEMTGSVAKNENVDADQTIQWVTTKLAADIVGKSNNNITFAIADGKKIYTGATEATYTLYIPQLTQDITVNFTKSNTGVVDLTANTLQIKDASGADNSNYNVTFNFATGFAGGSNQIELNTKAGVTLAGDFGKLPTGTNDAVTATGVKMLTLGTAANAFTPSQTANTVQQVTVISGNVATPNVAAGKNGSNNNVASVNINVKSDGDVNVGQNIKKITALGANSVTVTDATDVETNAKTININAEPNDEVNLTLAKGVQNINLNGGIISSVAETGVTDYKFPTNSNTTIAVTSKGNSAITCVPAITNNKVSFTLTSSFDGSIDGGAAASNHFSTATVTAKDYKNADVTGCIPIFTAAQLAAAANFGSGTAKKYALMTEITDLKEWKSPNIGNNSVEIYGNGKTIKTIDAPLFGTIDATDIKMDGIKITTATVTSTVATGTGILANRVALGKDVTVINSSVAGSITAPSHAGGLIGIVSGTATFGNGATTGTNANKAAVTSNVAFTNSTTRLRESTNQGTFGQFIGQVAGTATINLDCSATGTFDKNALLFHLNVVEGTTKVGEFVGNSTLIGYSPNATSIKYGTKLGTETAYTLTTFNASGTTRNVAIDQETNVTYTFKLGGSNIDNEVDKSGVISGNEATIYHNAYTELK